MGHPFAGPTVLCSLVLYLTLSAGGDALYGTILAYITGRLFEEVLVSHKLLMVDKVILSTVQSTTCFCLTRSIGTHRLNSIFTLNTHLETLA